MSFSVYSFKKYLVLLLAMLVFCSSAQAAKISEFCRILNADPLPVEGIGIVYGLNGTGDSSDAVRIMVKKYLEANKYNFSESDLSSKNIAMVSINAKVMPFARPGDKIDLRVSSINGASSLANGVLKGAVLRFHTSGDAIVRAEGRISVGDNPTTGLISGGGLVMDSKMVNRPVVDKSGVFRLILERPSYTDAAVVANNINTDLRTNPSMGRVVGFGDGSDPKVIVARARDPKEVVVKIPAEFMHKQVEYISRVLGLEVRVESVAEIRLNKQAGIAVVTGEVEVQPGFISYKGRTVTLTQPEGEGAPRYTLDNDTPRSLVDVHGPFESGGVGLRSLQSLVDTLSAMRCNTDDIIGILKEMKSAGLIQANLVVQ